MDEKILNLDPMNDVLFKFIFGSEERKSVTIDLLNAVFEGQRVVEDIQFLNTEFSPQRLGEKLSRIDIFALLNSGEKVDIEVQCVNYHNMAKRTLFYWSHIFLHHSSIRAGENYLDLKPVITVNLLRYKFLPQENPHAVYSIYNAENNHKLTDALELHFIELPKFKKIEISEMNHLQRWLSFFSRKLSKEEMEELVMSESAIQKAADAMSVFTAEDVAFHEYLNRQAAIWDYNSLISGSVAEGKAIGLKEGKAIGLKEGRAEGRAEGRVEGRVEGEDKMSKLIEILSKNNRTQEILAAATDKNKRKELYQEFGIE